jgi:hypothetical protein
MRNDERAYEDFLDAEAAARADSYYDPSAVTQQDWGHYWHRHRERVICDELRASGLGERARLIELGCGIGTVATYLNENDFSVDYGDVRAGIGRGTAAG